MADIDVRARYGEVYDRGYQHYLGKRLGLGRRRVAHQSERAAQRDDRGIVGGGWRGVDGRFQRRGRCMVVGGLGVRLVRFTVAVGRSEAAVVEGFGVHEGSWIGFRVEWFSGGWGLARGSGKGGGAPERSRSQAQ